MPNRKPPRGGPIRRAARRPAQNPPKPGEPTAQAQTARERAPNRPDLPNPLNAEERAALEAGWSFVE
jgi:hypothetical protein